jgi:hypothetical protein
VPINAERVLEGAAEPFPDAHRVGDAGDVVNQHSELVARNARERQRGIVGGHGVGGAQARLEPLRDGNHQTVGRRPAEAVTDRPHSIEA